MKDEPVRSFLIADPGDASLSIQIRPYKLLEIILAHAAVQGYLHFVEAYCLRLSNIDLDVVGEIPAVFK